MKRYFITTPANEDRPELTCEYGYKQWTELKDYFRKNNIPHRAYIQYS